MRPEIKEYNYDWMLWKTMDAAVNMGKGSLKEFKRALRYIPYFSGVLEPLISEGKAGELFLDLMRKYLENIVNASENGKKTVKKDSETT